MEDQEQDGAEDDTKQEAEEEETTKQKLQRMAFEWHECLDPLLPGNWTCISKWMWPTAVSMRSCNSVIVAMRVLHLTSHPKAMERKSTKTSSNTRNREGVDKPGSKSRSDTGANKMENGQKGERRNWDWTCSLNPPEPEKVKGSSTKSSRTGALQTSRTPRIGARQQWPMGDRCRLEFSQSHRELSRNIWSLPRARTERRQASIRVTVEILDSEGGVLIPAKSQKARKLMKLAEPAEKGSCARGPWRHNDTSRGTGDVRALRPGQGAFLDSVHFRKRQENIQIG